MTDEEFENEIDRELDAISSKAGDFIVTCQAKSCFDGFGELRTRAEREGRAVYYIHGTFFQMTQAANLLDFNTTKERAIKLISLLQKPEECFKIQPDMSEELYDFIVHDLSSCVYENLADAAGQMEGFNSKGLHDSIAGGIQVCRNTGKLGCIQCFREYAGDVYLAADDADLARHQCQIVVDHVGEWQSRGNRRWLAMMKMGWIEVMQGDFELAAQRYAKAMELTDEAEVNVPMNAKFDVLVQADAVRIVTGEKAELNSHEIFSQLPSREECPMFHLLMDQNVALESAKQNDYSTADEIYASWDKKLSSLNALHLWFENRLRWLALKRVFNQTDSLDSMAESLEEKANEADDWLSIRRLSEIMGDDADPSLLGVRERKTNVSVASMSQRIEVDGSEKEAAAVYNGADVADSDVADAAIENEDIANDENGKGPSHPFGDEEPQLLEKLDKVVEKMRNAYEEESFDRLDDVVDELIAITPEESSTNSDTCGVLNVMSMILSPLIRDRHDEIWKWANRLAAPFRENGVVLSLLATIGNEIRLMGEDPEEGKITPSRIEQLFRKSLELEKNGPQTYTRAGVFFMDREDLGEAEKCFARGFKLDRLAGNIALKLAEVYNMTDRPRDALHVLDLCLREGCESEQVAWEAMMNSFHLRQFEPMLNYLNRYEELVGETSPINYYRGVAYLNLKEPQASLDAIRKELEFCEPGDDFHCCVIEYCALVALGDFEKTTALAEKCVAAKAGELDYIPAADVAFLYETLWRGMSEDKPDSSILAELESTMLAAAYMPDDFFDALRAQQEPQEGVKFYRVMVHQSLGEDWEEHEGCWPGQEEWKSYYCEWGVLALTEEAARECVLEMQARCYSGYAEIVDVNTDDQEYVDTPGVVWQGMRYSIPNEFNLEDDETDDGDYGDDRFGDDDEFGNDEFNGDDSSDEDY